MIEKVVTDQEFIVLHMNYKIAGAKFGAKFLDSVSKSLTQAPVVQRLDNAIHRINHYPVDKC